MPVIEWMNDKRKQKSTGKFQQLLITDPAEIIFSFCLFNQSFI